MALAVLTLSCFMLYATSKYFPVEGISIVKQHKVKVILFASAISLLSLYLFTFSYDFATSLMYWMVAFMAILSAVILSVKMNLKWLWVWGVICVFFIAIDLN